jgi:hypothetical protein
VLVAAILVTVVLVTVRLMCDIDGDDYACGATSNLAQCLLRKRSYCVVTYT